MRKWRRKAYEIEPKKKGRLCKAVGVCDGKTRQAGTRDQEDSDELACECGK